MDVSKPGAGGFSAPILEPGGQGAGSKGGAGGARFADVMDGGGASGGAGGQPQAAHRTPFTSPILDADVSDVRRADPTSRRKVGGLEEGLRSDNRRPTVQMIGERNGIAPSDPGQGPVSFRDLANKTMKAEDKIDAMIEAARKGKTFSANDLLVMQVEVFRYSQTVEVVSKTTEKVVGGIKQTLGTQV